MIDWLRHIDRVLFLFINAHHCEVADYIMWYFSYKYTWIPLYILILFLIFKYNKRKRAVFMTIFIIVAIGLSNFISSEILKNVVCRLRPTHVPELQSKIHLVRGYTGFLYGFASSHAANSITISLLSAWFLQSKKACIILTIWALIVSYSRIYLGVHYPGDIIGGLLVGIVVSIGTIKLFQIAEIKYNL